MFKKIIRFIALAPFAVLYVTFPLIGAGILGVGLWCVFGELLWGKIFAVATGIWVIIFGYYMMYEDKR